MRRKSPLGVINVIVAALFIIVVAGWLLNTLLPHLWLRRVFWG